VTRMEQGDDSWPAGSDQLASAPDLRRCGGFAVFRRQRRPGAMSPAAESPPRTSKGEGCSTCRASFSQHQNSAWLRSSTTRADGAFEAVEEPTQELGAAQLPRTHHPASELSLADLGCRDLVAATMMFHLSPPFPPASLLSSHLCSLI